MVTTRHAETGEYMTIDNVWLTNYPVQSWPNTERDGKNGGHGVAYKRDSTNRIIISSILCYISTEENDCHWKT